MEKKPPRLSQHIKLLLKRLGRNVFQSLASILHTPSTYYIYAKVRTPEIYRPTANEMFLAEMKIEIFYQRSL